MLTNYAKEAMGFKPILAGKSIEASFYSLHVFKVRGFTLKDQGVVTHTETISNVRCHIALAQSINQACRALLKDDFVYADNEEQWAKDRKCTPPYVLVQFGPTAQHTATDGHVKADGTRITTYDAFSAAREELNQLEIAGLPSIEMALACVLSEQGDTVELIPVERTVCGITSTGETIRDIRFTVYGALAVSTALSSRDLNTVIGDAGKLAVSVDPRVARFFQLGLRDQDDLKKFLYYFLAVEIEVHRAYAKVTKSQHVANAATISRRVNASVQQLLENRDNWRALADRFVWCVASVWKHMDDSDVQEFKRLKRIRDDIAHGNIAGPQNEDVEAIESLVKRIYREFRSSP